MTLALFVFVALILFGVVTDRATASIEDKIDISVYFKTNTSEDQILNIKQSLEGLTEVQRVSYISRPEALAIFKKNHQDDPTISQAVNALDTNPLDASLNIKAKRPDQYASIANYLASPDLARYVDSISYTKYQQVIDRLARIVATVTTGGLVLTLLLAILVGLVVFNTIRIAIYSNREEIGVMRVVGASNSFVRGPYVVEGIICGTIAAIAGLLIVAPVLYFVSPYLNVFIPGLNIFQYFYTHFLQLLLYELLFGVAIGALSSFVAVKRYLKN
jgi:cell division transport system permease protein